MYDLLENIGMWDVRGCQSTVTVSVMAHAVLYR